MTEENKIKCNYCGALNSPSNSRKATITYRNRGQLQKMERDVCKDKPCGGNLQMGYEG